MGQNGEGDSEEVKSKAPDGRQIVLICTKCRHHDYNNNTLLEIDFRRAIMSYVCRECNHENRVVLSPPTSNYASIGTGVGKR
jgi:hypothetical protein